MNMSGAIFQGVLDVKKKLQTNTDKTLSQSKDNLFPQLLIQMGLNTNASSDTVSENTIIGDLFAKGQMTLWGNNRDSSNKENTLPNEQVNYALNKTQQEENSDSAALLFTSPKVVNHQNITSEQLKALQEKAEMILTNITDKKSVIQAAPELLKILKQWGSLEKKGIPSSIARFFTPNQMMSTEQQETWQQLVQKFQKRSHLINKQQYATNAAVTTKDVAKWLHEAIINQQQVKYAPVKPDNLAFPAAQPLTSAEQYVIHLQQTQKTQPADEQMLDQFQKVLKKSQFLTSQQRIPQLSVTLRPENLGDMTVKFTQLNGEMAVKIIVSSHAAKDMLESHAHQLRHMFSPHQVIIEKQDGLSFGQAAQHMDKDGRAAAERDQSNSGDEQQQNQQQTAEEAEEDFQEILTRKESAGDEYEGY